jgi:enoyl-CoA hydratase
MLCAPTAFGYGRSMTDAETDPGQAVSTASGLRIERTATHWTLVLDRPDKANALSDELVEALHAALGAAHDAGVDVLVLRGEGRNFSAGFDFGGYEALGEGELLRRFVRIEQLLQAFARSPCLTVALAHGRNFGAGVDLFAACRWRVAADETTFRMPGLAFGIVLGTRRFAALVGADAARAILEGLQTFEARRAEALGFVTRIAEPDAWATVIDDAVAAARALGREQRATLYRTLDAGTHDADLADLVRSAAEPGLRQRIARYLAEQARVRR